MNEDYKKHLRGTLYAALYSLPLNLKGLILIPILTKKLNLSVYGAFVVAQTIISLVSGVSTLGLQMSLSQFLPVKKGTVEGARLFYSVFWTALATNGIVFLLFIMFATEIGREIGISSAAALEVGGIIALSSVFSVVVEYFRAAERPGTFLSIVGGRNYLEIAAIAFAVLWFARLNEIFASMLAVTFLFTIGTSVLVFPKIGQPQLRNLHVGPYLRYSLPLTSTTLLDWIINLSDRVLIGLMLGSLAVGLYNPGYALGSLILFVPTVLVTMLPPLVARLHDTGEMDTFDDIIRYSLKYFLLIAFPMFFGSLVLSKPLLAILSTSEIAEQGFFITPMVVLGAIFYGCARILLHVLQVKLQTQTIAKAWVVAALVNLILNVLLLKALGIVAAAISTAVAFFVAFAFIKKYADRLHPVRFNSIPIVRIALAGISMGLTVGVVYYAISSSMIANLGVGAVSYTLFLFGFSVFEEREKRLMGSLLGRAFQFAR
jgi:O-antigen/teichoic acid export membrane protein